MKPTPKEKAAIQKKLDAKIKANQPAPRPTTPAPRPTPPKHTGDVRSIPKTPPAPQPTPPKHTGDVRSIPKTPPAPQPTPPSPIGDVRSIPKTPPPPVRSTPAGGTFAMKKGGSTSKASSRADGIAKKGKTKGRYI